jgi:hypothetical protein
MIPCISKDVFMYPRRYIYPNLKIIVLEFWWRLLARFWCQWEDIVKMVIWRRLGLYWLALSEEEWGSVLEACNHGNERAGCTNGRGYHKGNIASKFSPLIFLGNPELYYN